MGYVKLTCPICLCTFQLVQSDYNGRMKRSKSKVLYCGMKVRGSRRI